jgi:lipoprotein-anchoring transpeptidase ErfK/SrfK
MLSTLKGFKLIRPIALAAIAIVIFAATIALGADVSSDSPITASDAQRMNMLPPAPYRTLPPGYYAEPPEPSAEASPSAAAASPAASPAASASAGASAAASAEPDMLKLPKGIDGALTPGELAYRRTSDLSYIDPLSWSVMVYKKRHLLIVYYKGRMYRSYQAVFGRNLDDGTKEYEGDRRTPEGVYTIIEKHRNYRWRWFLTLNYPNLIDRLRYDELIDDRDLPMRGGHMVGVGGRIGIHGTDNPILNHGNVNWTTGCISVDNDSISQLEKTLPVGTIVIIKP